MNRVLSVAMMAVLPCFLLAQENKNATQTRPPNVETRMIRLQHADPHQVRDLLAGTGAKAQWDDQLRVVVVSGTPSEVASLEQTVKELDSEMARNPVTNAELTVYVLGASMENTSNRIPASLQKTVEQIRTSFTYQSYRLLETIVARCAIGDQTSTSGSLQPIQDSQPNEAGLPSYRLQFWLNGINTAGSREVFHIKRFDFSASFHYVMKGPNTIQTQQSQAGIKTDFDITSNQQVVIGKAGVAGTSAVFVIVEAKAVK
jgi:hypothetical protein